MIVANNMLQSLISVYSVNKKKTDSKKFPNVNKHFALFYDFYWFAQTLSDSELVPLATVLLRLPSSARLSEDWTYTLLSPIFIRCVGNFLWYEEIFKLIQKPLVSLSRTFHRNIQGWTPFRLHFHFHFHFHFHSSPYARHMLLLQLLSQETGKDAPH